MSYKIYKSRIDLRVLSDKIKFIFYISGNVNAPTKKNKSYNKTKAFTFIYNTNRAVEVATYTDNNISERVFLKFPASNIQVENYNDILSFTKTDLILEVFRNKQGVFGFEEVKGGGWGAFLSHKNYFDVSTGYGSTTGSGALKSLGKRVSSKSHAIQMVIPGIRVNKKIGPQISFDLDILIEYQNQYINTLGFKITKDNVITIQDGLLDIKSPRQIINQTKELELDTTYIKLSPKDLASRKVLYDYKKQLFKYNADIEGLNLISSKVYAIENNIVPDVNLDNVNLTPNNRVQIPYNVSRSVFNNNITATKKYFKEGKEIYQLDWAQELFNNNLVTKANKCYSLKFSTEEQLVAFAEKLKNQQIGNIETYPAVDNTGAVTNIRRTYSNISQWVERTTLDQFNDISFTYNSNGLIKTILSCPRKKTLINEIEGKQDNLYTSGGELIYQDGRNYSGAYHIQPEKGIMEGAYHTDLPHQTLTRLFNYAPISGDSKTDFLFTTYSNKTNSIYAGFSTTTTDKFKSNDTYDLLLSGATYSASTIIPITNIRTLQKLPLIDDITKEYRPYIFNKGYTENGGNIVLNEADATKYLTYSVSGNGIYRFTYKAYLDIKYTDTKWCNYLSRAYPSGITGTYPSTDYEIKRLINTSIIQAGEGESETVVLDTNYKFHPGYKFKSAEEKRVSNIPNNSGILNFNFNVRLNKFNSGSTASTVIKEFKVLRSKLYGTANDYLTLPVSQIDKASSGTNVCVLSGVSSSTIFHKQIPVIIETGFINLTRGQSLTLSYDTNWTTDSKSNYFGDSGTTNLKVNLGHQLDASGNTKNAPWFRGVKVGNEFIYKKLFFDSTQKSKPFKMVSSGEEKQVRTDGTLYLTDKECGNITIPIVDKNTFNKLTFLDTTGENHMLIWNQKVNTPTNNWQKLIENNTIKDYILPKCPINICPITEMYKDGVFCFNLPIYNDDYGAKCDFTFPQIKQSYVIQNIFKNMFGNELVHYIVVTPECSFHKPCSPSKVNTAYDILHKNIPQNWKLVNVDKKLKINGKEIKIISSESHYNPGPITLPGDFRCQYYCKCGQGISEEIGIDPIYGVSDVYTNLELLNCDECYEEAKKHCTQLYQTCEPIMVGNCDETEFIVEPTGKIVTKSPALISTTLLTTTDDGGGTKPPKPPGPWHPPGGPKGPKEPIKTHAIPPVDSRYTCDEGVCVLYTSQSIKAGVGSPGGKYKMSVAATTSSIIYASLEKCMAACTTTTLFVKPLTPSDEQEQEQEQEETGGSGGGSDDELSDDGDRPEEMDTDKEGVCHDGYYWCEEMGDCITIDEPCGGYV